MAYDDVMRRRVVLGERRLTVRLKAGMPAWEEVEAALLLLAEEAEIPPGARVLVLESGCGALAAWAALGGAEVHAYDGDIVGQRMTEATLAANDIDGVSVYPAVVPAPGVVDVFDVALLRLPKGRAYARSLLGAAYRALKAGGRLYFAGPNAGGAKAIVKDATAIFGRAATLRTKARNRVAMAVKLATPAESVPPFEPFAEFDAMGLHLFTAPGVFSRDALDDGTALLLETLDPSLCQGKRVLDVGCGYGVIGMTAAQLGAESVGMIDSAWLAVACTAQGITANRLGAVCTVWASDLYADVGEGPYDLILSNPPFHAGHMVDTDAAHALIAGAAARLASGGRLRVVANLFLPYAQIMADVFRQDRVTVVKETPRYRVIQAVK